MGTMALIAALCSVCPTPKAAVTQCFVNQQVNLDLAFADGNEVRVDDLDVKGKYLGWASRIFENLMEYNWFF